MSTMQVIYNRPNSFDISYFDKDVKKNKFHCFHPGINEIEISTWKHICNTESIFKKYKHLFTVPLATIDNNVNIGVKKISITAIKDSEEAIRVIENTNLIQDLVRYRSEENKNKPKRIMVLNAIKNQIEKIEEIDKRIEKAGKKD
jgi:hypothetical protein